MYDTPFSWNKNINSCIHSYFPSQICIDNCIFGKRINGSESENFIFRLITSTKDTNDSNSILGKNYENLHENEKLMWIECENCYEVNYQKGWKLKMNICQYCGCH